MNIKNQKIAVVVYGEFDYWNDYIEHSRNLSEHFPVTVICSHTSIASAQNLNVIQFDKKFKNSALDRLRFNLLAAIFLAGGNYSHIIANAGRFVFLIALAIWFINLFKYKKAYSYFDLRTGSVSGKKDDFKNFLFRIESLFFTGRIAISSGLAQKVFKTKKKIDIIGVGTSQARIISKTDRLELKNRLGIKEKDLVFIYAGKFTNRQLDRFLNLFDYKENFKLLLIGDGDSESTNKLKNKVQELGIVNNTIFTGKIKYDDLYKYYNIADIGIAYIPKIAMYEYQPPTKIFEYAEYGLQILTTKTTANIEIASQIDNILFIEDYTTIRSMPLVANNGCPNRGVEKYYWMCLSEIWLKIMNSNANE